MNDMEKILYDRYLDFWAYIYDIEKEEIKSLIKYTKYINNTLIFPYSLMDLIIGSKRFL